MLSRALANSPKKTSSIRMTKYIIDSYAWIEYLEGSEKGGKVESIISDGSNEIYSHILTVSEVIGKTKRRDMNIESAFSAVTLFSKLIAIDVDSARNAGLFHAEMRKTAKDFGLADAFILISARRMNAKFVTGDPHFKSFKETIMI